MSDDCYGIIGLAHVFELSQTWTTWTSSDATVPQPPDWAMVTKVYHCIICGQEKREHTNHEPCCTAVEISPAVQVITVPAVPDWMEEQATWGSALGYFLPDDHPSKAGLLGARGETK